MPEALILNLPVCFIHIKIVCFFQLYISLEKKQGIVTPSISLQKEHGTVTATSSQGVLIATISHKNSWVHSLQLFLFKKEQGTVTATISLQLLSLIKSTPLP